MAVINFLEMSDEDLLKHAAPDFPTDVVSEPQTEVVEPEPVVEAAEVQEGEQAQGTDDEQVEPDGKQAEEGNPLAAADADLGDPPVVDEPAKPQSEKAEPVKDEAAKPVVEEEAKPAVISGDDFMKAVLAPFKANGKEMQVHTPEEARTLMQQGANYNKKMAGLKPHLAIVKQLEQNGLLDNDKIGFLIDLSKKNPEAIGKLIKDSGIDPLDLDNSKVDGYKPNTYAVSEEQMDFDSTLEELKDDEHFQPVLHDVANEWDVASQKIVAGDPNVLRVLTKHKELGVYDVVTNEVERRKALGQLRGTPTLKAYRDIGDELEAAGKLDHLIKPKVQAPPVTKIVPATTKPAESQAVIDKRKAAASTATVPAKKAVVDPDFNPLAMSDEDFAKYKPDFI